MVIVNNKEEGKAGEAFSVLSLTCHWVECKITRGLINGAQRFDLPRSIQGSLPCLLIRGISRIDGAYVDSL